jgi:hypothetical protein
MHNGSTLYRGSPLYDPTKNFLGIQVYQNECRIERTSVVDNKECLPIVSPKKFLVGSYRGEPLYKVETFFIALTISIMLIKSPENEFHARRYRYHYS